jgi:hypothetical protein
VPLDKYYKGKGKKVMEEMKREYGEEEGERVFYATANKRKKLRHGARKGPEKG